MTVITQAARGITIHRFSLLADHPGLLHGISDRRGGLSQGEYASLNMGLHVGDDPETVLLNRRRFCEAAGIDHRSLVVGEQIHAGSVGVVTRSDRGRGARDKSTAIEGTDALVCAEPGVPLMALGADCPLLIIFDPDAAVVALVHASWRSILAGILPAAVRVMADLGARPARLLAAIGPCVGKCCYCVRRDFLILVNGAMPDAESYIEERSGRAYFDLQAAVAAELCRAGMTSKRIAAAGLCTSCNSDVFYSFRASGGLTGRFAAFAQIVE